MCYLSQICTIVYCQVTIIRIMPIIFKDMCLMSMTFKVNLETNNGESKGFEIFFLAMLQLMIQSFHLLFVFAC